MSDSGGSPTTNFDDDHSERENVRFLAIYPLSVQNLWRSPSRYVALIGTRYGIRISSNCGKTEIRDPRATGGINKDVLLGMCQREGENNA